MRIKKFRIDIYDWTVFFMEAKIPKNARLVKKALKRYKAPKADIKYIYKPIKNR